MLLPSCLRTSAPLHLIFFIPQLSVFQFSVFSLESSDSKLPHPLTDKRKLKTDNYLCFNHMVAFSRLNTLFSST